MSQEPTGGLTLKHIARVAILVLPATLAAAATDWTMWYRQPASYWEERKRKRCR